MWAGRTSDLLCHAVIMSGKSRVPLCTLALLAGVLMSACGSTEPSPDLPSEPSLHHPLAGVYDLRTTLDTFHWETSSPSPPDCPTTGVGYCNHYRAFAGAVLSGILTLSDSASASGSMPVLSYSAEAEGSFCSAWSVPEGCTAVTPKPRHPLAEFYLYDASPSDTVDHATTYAVELRVPNSSGLGERIALRYHVSGDSLYGRVGWSLTGGRSPPSHTGSFVAIRRR
jgi:hypothetical protein